MSLDLLRTKILLLCPINADLRASTLAEFPTALTDRWFPNSPTSSSPPSREQSTQSQQSQECAVQDDPRRLDPTRAEYHLPNKRRRAFGSYEVPNSTDGEDEEDDGRAETALRNIRRRLGDARAVVEQRARARSGTPGRRVGGEGRLLGYNDNNDSSGGGGSKTTVRKQKERFVIVKYPSWEFVEVESREQVYLRFDAALKLLCKPGYRQESRKEDSQIEIPGGMRFKVDVPEIEAGNGVVLFVQDLVTPWVHAGRKKYAEKIPGGVDHAARAQQQGSEHVAFRRHMGVPGYVPEGSGPFYEVWLAVEKIKQQEGAQDGGRKSSSGVAR